MVTVFSAQYAEHGRALTKAAGGAASRWTRAADSSRPRTASTPPSDDGIVSAVSLERSTVPSTEYWEKVVANALAA